MSGRAPVSASREPETELAPGRALDVEIAVRVMGATWRAVDELAPGCEWLRMPNDHGKPINADTPVYAARGPLYGLDGADGLQVWDYCPPFSRSVEAAWLVVEKMGDSCSYFELKMSGTSWYAAFIDGGASGASAAHAICLAALASFKNADARAPAPESPQ